MRPEPDIPLTRQELAELQKQFGTMSESALQPSTIQHIGDVSSSTNRRRRDQYRNWSLFGSICGGGNVGFVGSN